jgi:hypothetical protein
LPTWSRNCAAEKEPSFAEADRSAIIVVISPTVDRKKKRSCATSSAQPIRPARLRARRKSFSTQPVAAARSRTLGGRNRCAPPRSGATISQAALSSGASCTSCDGSLTNAPSRTSCPEAASFFNATSNAGFGSFGCDVTRSCSRQPCARPLLQLGQKLARAIRAQALQCGPTPGGESGDSPQ